MKSRRWTFGTLGIVGMLLFASALWFYKELEREMVKEYLAAMEMPLPGVIVEEVAVVEYAPTRRFTASIHPWQEVVLRSEIGGRVDEVLFESGQWVGAGDALLRVDNRMDHIRLQSAQVGLMKLTREKERLSAMHERGAASTDALENAQVAEAEARALVQSLMVSLEKSALVAPFSGRVGLRQIHAGEVLAPGQAVVSLVDSSQLRLRFSVPVSLLPMLREGAELRMRAPDHSSLDGYPVAVSSLSPELDVDSRMLVVEAWLEPTCNDIQSGTLIEVEIATRPPESMVAVPASALQRHPTGASVWILVEGDPGGEGLVERREVTIQGRKGDWYMIANGIGPGDRVVVAGGFKDMGGKRVWVSDKAGMSHSMEPDPRNT